MDDVVLMSLVLLLKKPTFVRCVKRSWVWYRISILGLEWNRSTLFWAQMVIHLVGPPMAFLDLKVNGCIHLWMVLDISLFK